MLVSQKLSMFFVLHFLHKSRSSKWHIIFLRRHLRCECTSSRIPYFLRFPSKKVYRSYFRPLLKRLWEMLNLVPWATQTDERRREQNLGCMEGYLVSQNSTSYLFEQCAGWHCHTKKKTLSYTIDLQVWCDLLEI